MIEFHRRARGGFKSGERWEVAQRSSESAVLSQFEILSARSEMAWPAGGEVAWERRSAGGEMAWERSQHWEGIKRELPLIAEIGHARAVAKFLKSYRNNRTFLCA